MLFSRLLFLTYTIYLSPLGTFKDISQKFLANRYVLARLERIYLKIRV